MESEISTGRINYKPRIDQMEPSPKNNDRLTAAQRLAVAARGNVLVMAGAGTGKTHTLVERCLDCLGRERAALDEILVVTFTEAAAAEMKQRLRRVLEETSSANPDDLHWHEQLALFDAAHIGTLHGFCFKLVCEHFYELGLDPQPAVLDEGGARLLADETLDEELQERYAGSDAFAVSVQQLIRFYGGARDEKVRSLVLRLHHYAQTRPDADGWLAGQIAGFSAAEPAAWRGLLLDAVRDWNKEWLPVLTNLGAPSTGSARFAAPLPHRAEPVLGAPVANEKAAELAAILGRLPEDFSRAAAADVLEQILAADGIWPAKRKTVLRKPLAGFFEDAAFLRSLAAVKGGIDPLAEDWSWVRDHMTALLRLTQHFAARFAARKRDEGVLDFHDLEQFALRLLSEVSTGKPTSVAERWRGKLRFVFVDEYQDINAAQDRIIQALSREGADANRFLVGDVKQSIYRFRLADPGIFRDYAKHWQDENGATIPLADNFRSCEGLIHFVNSVFGLLMREEVGGVIYGAGAELKFGAPESRAEFSVARNPLPRAELLLRLKRGRGDISDGEEGQWTDLGETEKEARLLALRLRELKDSGHEIRDDKTGTFRPAGWRDMAVLLRSPAGKAEMFAKQFERAGVPLVVARSGFYESSEILDLLSLLQLLDNPLQDVPCIAVLRSPLAGCSLDELAVIRLAAPNVHFWTALNRARNTERGVRDELRRKSARFLEQFSRWRKLARQASLSQCLEDILAGTHYADWLRSQPRGGQRRANVEQFLNLARKFDGFQRQGLFRFLKFIEAQREAEIEPDVPAAATENAVRLMSIHQSKGLEFPVVAIADLAKPFNLQDLRGEIILDEHLGLCPRIQPPQTGARYPSLPHWLAQRRQHRDLLGEELRLLYVAMTRARDTLILSAGISEKKWDEKWTQPPPVTAQDIARARSFADWLGLWFVARSAECGVRNDREGAPPELRLRITDDSGLADQPEIQNPESEIEPPVLDAATIDKLRTRLEWNYPFAAAARRKAKSSVTALRREAEESDGEAEQLFAEKRFARGRTQRSAPRTLQLAAAETGRAHHRFLQHAALEKAGDRAALEAESRRLESEKILSAEERAALDLEALADFWNSEVGKKIHGKREWVRRELPFTAKFSPAELAQITGAKAEPGLADEFVVVQGVADLVVLLPMEIWLLDFKTDEIRAGGLKEKTGIYAPQLKLYAAALGKVYSRPVANCWLHFLGARKTVDVDM
jgi:ATP-dependent helicase/nuclease subunit A